MIQRRLPDWFRRFLPEVSAVKTHETLAACQVNTVCDSALCPNKSECYSRRTTAFMILGDVCTRRCGFCAVQTGRPKSVDPGEPKRVARAAKSLELDHVVITSVSRDDLRDEGAQVFYETICAVHEALPSAAVEILTPDFHGRPELIGRVCEAGPAVFNHNIETVRRLTKRVRPQARYERSLEVLRLAKSAGTAAVVKSGLMMGFGETFDEVLEALQDLRAAGVDVVTIGQYLRPQAGALKVETFIHPEVFRELRNRALEFGFSEVYAGPYVRSSYHAGEIFKRSERSRPAPACALEGAAAGG